MNIRTKTLSVILPLFISTLLLTSAITISITRTTITELVLNSFISKSSQLNQYILQQWELLVSNELENKKEMLDIFLESILSQSRSILESDTEKILIFDSNDEILINSIEDGDAITPVQIGQVKEIISTGNKVSSRLSPLIEYVSNITKLDWLSTSEKKTIDHNEGAETIAGRGWIDTSFPLGSQDYKGYYFHFAPRNITTLVLITEEEFLRPIRQIILTTLILTVILFFIIVPIIFRFSRSLVRPIKSVVTSMQHIVEHNDFETEVEVQSQDEIGYLTNTFNGMIKTIDYSYKEIKKYAFSTIVARQREQKVRSIFQKYVPASVIDQLFKSSEKMLSGENKELTVMFTDIRRFTTISEQHRPDELVQMLNTYFKLLVDIIAKNEGIIDKYIGDAIMAFYGAPVDLKNSPENAVAAALEMMGRLRGFNNELKNKGLSPLITGIGISYGKVTVGNIGSDKKMDYTVIGDSVNLASRLEGLTKKYRQQLVFSSSVAERIQEKYTCRLIDLVQVKGRSIGEKIYTTSTNQGKEIRKIYTMHNHAVGLYLKREFSQAKEIFQDLKKMLPSDHLAGMYIQRCSHFIDTPPPKNWDGTYVMTKK